MTWRSGIGAMRAVSRLLLCVSLAAEPSAGAGAQQLSFKLSASAVPVEFTIGGVRYKMPRNYIVQMDDWSGGPQTLVELRVTFPGLAPRSPDTEQCLDGPISFDGRKCAPQDFFVSRGYPSSDEQAFENARKYFNSTSPEPAPFGFERYETGPATARVVTYRKQIGDRTLMFQCLRSGVDGAAEAPRESAVCTRHSRLPSGNELGYHFYEGQLAVIEDKDEGLRKLVRSFEIS